MPSFTLALFALKTNAVFFALVAIWMFAIGALSGGTFQVSGFTVWGIVSLLIALAAAVSLRGLKNRRAWAWFTATLIALFNLWSGVRSVMVYSNFLTSVYLSRQAAAACLIAYFFLAGGIMLLGLYGRREAPAETLAEEPAETAPEPANGGASEPQS